VEHPLLGQSRFKSLLDSDLVTLVAAAHKFLTPSPLQVAFDQPAWDDGLVGLSLLVMQFPFLVQKKFKNVAECNKSDLPRSVATMGGHIPPAFWSRTLWIRE